MKLYNKALLDLEHKVDLSRSGTCASCSAAQYHGTKQYAREAVAQHRAISREVRRAVAHLLKNLDWFDSCVEEAHQEVVGLKLPERDLQPITYETTYLKEVPTDD